MTAVVGVLCKDGAVIGTDSSATFALGQGVRTIEQPTEKLDLVEDRIIIAGTGQIGLGQRFRRVVERAWGDKIFQKEAIDVGRELCKRACEDFAFTGATKGQYGALVAFPAGDKACLCEFAVSDFQPELKVTDRIWYASMGSAQPITDPFLAFMREVLWGGGPPLVQEAILAVVWTLDHAIAVNPGGVNGPARIGVLDRGEKGKLGARLLAEADLEEHREMINQAKERLAAIRGALQPAKETPQIPTA